VNSLPIHVPNLLIKKALSKQHPVSFKLYLPFLISRRLKSFDFSQKVLDKIHMNMKRIENWHGNARDRHTMPYQENGTFLGDSQECESVSEQMKHKRTAWDYEPRVPLAAVLRRGRSSFRPSHLRSLSEGWPERPERPNAAPLLLPPSLSLHMFVLSPSLSPSPSAF